MSERDFLKMVGTKGKIQEPLRPGWEIRDGVAGIIFQNQWLEFDLGNGETPHKLFGGVYPTNVGDVFLYGTSYATVWSNSHKTWEWFETKEAFERLFGQEVRGIRGEHTQFRGHPLNGEIIRYGKIERFRDGDRCSCPYEAPSSVDLINGRITYHDSLGRLTDPNPETASFYDLYNKIAKMHVAGKWSSNFTMEASDILIDDLKGWFSKPPRYQADAQSTTQPITKEDLEQLREQVGKFGIVGKWGFTAEDVDLVKQDLAAIESHIKSEEGEAKEASKEDTPEMVEEIKIATDWVAERMREGCKQFIGVPPDALITSYTDTWSLTVEGLPHSPAHIFHTSIPIEVGIKIEEQVGAEPAELSQSPKYTATNLVEMSTQVKDWFEPAGLPPNKIAQYGNYCATLSPDETSWNLYHVPEGHSEKLVVSIGVGHAWLAYKKWIVNNPDEKMFKQHFVSQEYGDRLVFGADRFGMYRMLDDRGLRTRITLDTEDQITAVCKLNTSQELRTVKELNSKPPSEPTPEPIPEPQADNQPEQVMKEHLVADITIPSTSLTAALQRHPDGSVRWQVREGSKVVLETTAEEAYGKYIDEEVQVVGSGPDDISSATMTYGDYFEMPEYGRRILALVKRLGAAEVKRWLSEKDADGLTSTEFFDESDNLVSPLIPSIESSQSNASALPGILGAACLAGAVVLKLVDRHQKAQVVNQQVYKSK